MLTHSAFLMAKEKFKYACLLRAIADFNTEFGRVKGFADALPVFEDYSVKSVRKSDSCLVLHLTGLLYADDVLGSHLLEDASDVLRVACGHKDKLQLALVLSYHLFEHLLADQFPFAAFRLQKQEISLTDQIWVANLVSWDSMAAKVQSKRLLF